MSDKKKFLTKKKAIALVIILLIIIALAAAYFAVFTAVDKFTVERASVDDYYTCEGVIENGGTYHILSEVNGRLLGYEVRENDTVTADTVIARIDSSDIERQLKAARAGAGGSSVAAAKRAYEVAKELYESGADSRLNYESALAEYQRASSEYAEQASTIARLEDQLSKCEIKAGKAGVVASLPGKNLSVVDTGSEIAVINCEGRPSVKLDVLTGIAPYVSEGDKVDVTIALKGRDEQYTGTVTEVYDYASAGVSALGLAEYRVRVMVDLDYDETLSHRDGYGVNIRFRIYSSDDVLVVPSSALFKVDGQDYVYKVSGSKAEAVPVSLEYNSSIKAVVAEGLSEGDVIVKYANTPYLSDGAYIR